NVKPLGFEGQEREVVGFGHWHVGIERYIYGVRGIFVSRISRGSCALACENAGPLRRTGQVLRSQWVVEGSMSAAKCWKAAPSSGTELKAARRRKASLAAWAGVSVRVKTAARMAERSSESGVVAGDAGGAGCAWAEGIAKNRRVRRKRSLR